ncbi:hypothetical protein C0992_004973 [Termitomyces sp. T32_za158]|nr:hypothetical protein C0992_004973 [Termitomyces sp. T32_za158]
MTLKPLAWLQEDDFYSNPSFHLIPSSGRESPHERQHMLPSEASQSMRPAYVVNDVEASSSDSPPVHYSQYYDNMSPSHRQDSSVEVSQKPGSEGWTHHSKLPRSASYNGVLPSRLNPVTTCIPQTLSPFSRSTRCGSAQIMRIPSEECRALSSGSPTSKNSSHTCGPMILYRKADTQDTQDDLSPPQLPHLKRNSTFSTDSVLSSDSKYPGGTMTLEHGLVAYAWDPLEDDAVDEEDKLHDFDWKTTSDSERSLSLRGFINIAALVILLSGLLSLFVMYPVFRHFNDDGRSELIVGNTRINSTGQASSVEFDPRSQTFSISVGIDPTTPQEAWIRRSQNGVLYHLVFSDEFNADGRSFYEDHDPFWEAVNDQRHENGLVTTQNGYLVLDPRLARGPGSRTGVQMGGLLKQRTSSCLDGGFVEVSVVSPSSPHNQRLLWTGLWTHADAGVPTQGASLSEVVSFDLILDAGNAATSTSE